METWKEVILYGFIAYLFLHLLLQDIVFLYETFRKPEPEVVYQPHEGNQEPGNPSSLTQTIHNDNNGNETGDIEANGVVFRDILLTFIKSGDRFANVNKRQSSLIILLSKICDIVLACVMGYFQVFIICWREILSCLKALITRYI